jgi:prephenate dehydratase
MITDEASFEAALQRVAAFLEHPPRDGTAQAYEFANVLEEVAQHQTQLQALPTASTLDGAVARAHDLMRDAAALRASRDAAERPRFSSFPEDGEGIGPTTGV